MPIKYFKKKEQYQERFYQLPKVFFTNETIFRSKSCLFDFA